MEAAIDGRIQTCARCPHPGSAWNGEAAGSREAVQPVLHTWLVVCGNEPVFLATAYMPRTAWDISHGTKGYNYKNTAVEFHQEAENPHDKIPRPETTRR